MFSEMVKDACEFAGISMTDAQVLDAGVSALKGFMEIYAETKEGEGGRGEIMYPGAVVAAAILHAKGVT